MKRRSFFSSLFVAPVVAACAAATVKPAMAVKPAVPLGELAVRVTVDTSRFEAALARESWRLKQVDAAAAKTFASFKTPRAEAQRLSISFDREEISGETRI